ncbi:NlpC/P60 family protein [Enterococcus sp. AZ196]|uniref:NlpC/P60 family protein n=1 Tax=Enterococcus sp. AZ196 TaxID=2774659 RepID=UPI003D2CC65A
MKKYSGLCLFTATLSALSCITLATTELANAEENIQTETSTATSLSTEENTSKLINSEQTTSSANLSDENNQQQGKAASTSNELEETKAAQAGFSQQQFEQIMNIPKLAAADLPPMPRATGQQNSVVSKAREQIGKPYAWGASGPNAFDCGGLVKYVYKQAVNVDLPMGTINQEKYGTEASMSDLQSGDLLFYGNRGATYHVGIYIGNNQMIHSPQPGQTVTAVDIKYFYPNFARRILKSAGTDPNVYPSTDGQASNERFIFRMYNKNDGQHHYTQLTGEAVNLINVGWNYEGVGWVSPATGASVYRMYNPNNGRHHYTPHAYEKDNLVKVGWKYEGVSWYTGGNVPVYRLYNPHAAPREDSHHYTPFAYERDSLVKAGWKSEGTAWYATRVLN